MDYKGSFKFNVIVASGKFFVVSFQDGTNLDYFSPIWCVRLRSLEARQ